MKDGFDIKLLGLNGGVLAAITLADIQTALEITLVVVTLLYTFHRYIRFLRQENNDKKDDNGK